LALILGSHSERVTRALESYVSATLKQIVARTNKDWNVDVEATDEAYADALQVADAISDGLIEHSSRGVGTSGIR